MSERDIFDGNDGFEANEDLSTDGLDSSVGEPEGLPTDPIDPATPDPIDPVTPDPIDPVTPEGIDPVTPEGIDPAVSEGIDPATSDGIDPARGPTYSLPNPDGTEADAFDVPLEDNTIATMVDRDRDGYFEQALLDLNTDQQVDVMLHYEEGQPEPVAMQVDRNSNGLFRTTWLPEEDKVIYSDKEGNVKWVSEGEGPPRQFQLVYDAVTGQQTEQPATYADPASVSLDEQPPLAPDGVHGDADVELQYWEYQKENGLCVPTSITMILSEFGIDASRTDVVDRAVDLELMTTGPNEKFGRWSGMTATSAEHLLADFGVDSNVHNGTMDNLETFLDENRDIIVTVDGHEVWKDVPDTGRDPNHMLLVTEIDEDRGIVTLNDPGSQGGGGFEMSIGDFKKAWADGNNEMVVTEPVSDQVTLSEAGAQKGAPVLLPMVVRATLGADGETAAETFDETGEGTPDTIRLPEGATLRMDDQGLLISLTSEGSEAASEPPQTTPAGPVTSPSSDASSSPVPTPTSAETVDAASDPTVLDPSGEPPR